MPPDLDPSLLQSWTPYAIVFILMMLAGWIGSALPWASTKGVSAYIKLQEFRAKVRAIKQKEKIEQETARLEQEKRKRLIDRFVEGKMTVEGYKNLLLVYDDRLRDLEEKDIAKTKTIITMSNQLTDCLQKHAEESAGRKALYEQIEEMRKRQEIVDEKCLGLQLKLQRLGASDPWPSPPPHQSPE